MATPMAFLLASLFGVTLFGLGYDLLPASWHFGWFTGFYLALGLLAVHGYRRGRFLDVFAPLLPGLVLLYLYAAASALAIEVTGISNSGDVISPGVLRPYYLACLLGGAGLGLGSVLSPHPGSDPFSRALGPEDGRFLRILWVLAPILGCLCLPWLRESFDVLHVKGYVQTAGEGRLIKQAMGSSQPLQEVFLTQVPRVLILALAVLAVVRTRNLGARLLGAGVLFLHGATLILGGQRGILAMFGAFLLAFWHYRIRPMTFPALAGVFVAGFLMTSTLSFVRVTSDPAEMVRLLGEGLRSGDTGFLAFRSSTEFAVGQNLMRLIDGLDHGQARFTHGASILTEAETYIPRILYSGRPLPMSERFLEVFYPGIREEGGGLGFFILMEGYWAFGLPGVFLSMVFFGWALDRVYLAFSRNGMTDFSAMWYGYVLYSCVFMSIRTGLLGTFKVALMVSLPFLLVKACSRLAGRPAIPTDPLPGSSR